MLELSHNTTKESNDMANILIVEDEESINDLILMNIKLAGHVGKQALDGNEAIAAIGTNVKIHFTTF